MTKLEKDAADPFQILTRVRWLRLQMRSYPPLAVFPTQPAVASLFGLNVYFFLPFLLA